MVDETRWECPRCQEQLEPQFTECWSCGYGRGSGGDESLKRFADLPHPLTCPLCRIRLAFIGTRRFHEGSQLAPFALGGIGELLVNREEFQLYGCSRCGRVELFAKGVGDEFR